MTTVLIVDDQDLIREGFRGLIDVEPDLAVIGAAADGDEGVRLARELRPDVVVMDIRMPIMDGLEATRRIRGDASLQDTHVLILTTFHLDEYVFAALRAGASGFLLKDAPIAELRNAIRVVASGEALLAPSVTRTLIEEFIRRPDPPAHLPAAAFSELTAREVEIAGLVAEGLSNAEIAERLVLSHATVKTHISRILAKLDLRDRVQLVIAAFEAGLTA
ncbi:MAG: response regulator transcription factor [Dehalococcoidia bacterium]|nr:response regulator transcription factor [Dehalococcoidia bacterium]HRC62283.1 response regulator transcription factor [Dehalococcoidia bacterium]